MLLRKKKGLDKAFIGIVMSLVICGLTMLWSASYVISYYQYENSWHFILKQFTFAVFGIIVMFVFSRLDYKVYFKFAGYIYSLSIFLLVAVLFMRPVNGAKRWISLGPGSFQPSEVAKFALIVIVAKFVTLNKGRMQTFKYGVVKLLFFMGFIAGLLILEPHISGTVLIFSIGAVMMFVGGTNLLWFVLATVFLLCCVFVVIFVPGVADYATARVSCWLNPFAVPRGQGYQVVQSLFAICAGGVFGVGIGGSKQKQLYLPEPHNDFIFSIICEELGLIGATIVILMFSILIYRGFKIAKRIQDDFGRMLVVGIIAHVGVQALFNIAVVTNTIPNTGINLPFFSYGGTSLLMLLAEMGIVLAADKFGAEKRIYKL
jgi:cell division protein FtsW